MIVKHPKPVARKILIKGAIIAFGLEALLFTASYFGWTKINKDRETRKYLRDNYPSLLEAYYKTGELISKDLKIREIDQAHWNADVSSQDYPGLDKQTIAKNQQYMNVLQAAQTSDKPLYRLSKEEIDKAIRK